MPTDRRQFLLGSVASAAAPLSAYGLDAAQFGLRAGAPDDQSSALQRALDQAARTRAPLVLAPGVYRAGDLNLPAGAQLIGVRGATRLILTHGPSLLSTEGGDNITLTGLTLEGGGHALPQNRGLVHFTAAKGVRIVDCTVIDAGGNGIALERCEGSITASTITGADNNALFCVDNTGLIISANTIRNSGNGGIRVWQSVKRHDGSIVADNTIDDTAARSGGTGENGNAINVFRAADVIVRNNLIRRAAFSAIRGNAASNIQIIGNNCADLKETAMYAEFDFEGAAVTGNVIENAPYAGIRLGFGPYLRNVTAVGNVVRDAGIGIAVSVVPDAGSAAISGNIIQGAKRGAIVGMEWHKPVTGDLLQDGAERYPQLKLNGNQAR